ncbi:MAG: YecR family lipoprotein [Alphaproteobacteria bacterium]
MRAGLNIAAILLTTVLAGCTVVRVPTPTGGSRADGTINMSFELGSLQNAKVDWEGARKTAAQRCKVWGYNDAQAFGGSTRRCNFPSGNGCARWLITRSYQCTGKKLVN